MTIINPAEYGARFPAEAMPAVDPALVEEFAAEVLGLAPEADAGVLLFGVGVAACGPAIHSIHGPGHAQHQESLADLDSIIDLETGLAVLHSQYPQP